MKSSPLFFWGMQFLIGCSLALHFHSVLFFPSLFLLFLHKWQDIVFLLAGFGFFILQCPSHNFTEVKGYGDFVLKEIHPAQSPFKRSYALKGHFKTFKSEDKYYHNIPCMFFQDRPPKTGSRWIIEGKLQKKNRGYVFKPHKQLPWQELRASSFPRWRFEKKQAVRKYFHKKIKDKRTSHFFASMATGDTDDRLLAMEFRKVGLGHILAISGFHFAIIAAILGFILKKIFSTEMALVYLIGILTLYFLYLGPSPSILRAYIMITLYLFCTLINRRVEVLNLLGAALFIEILHDPYTITHAGFQLSFLATLGILLFFRPIQALLEKLFPKRSLPQLKQLGPLDKHGYLAITFIRNALSLNFSVLLATLPATLFIFHQFPLFTIPYNIIFPPLLSISMILIPFPFLRFFSVKYTHWLLQMIANPPELLNYKIYTPNFPYSLTICTITLNIFMGLKLSDTRARARRGSGGISRLLKTFWARARVWEKN